MRTLQDALSALSLIAFCAVVIHAAEHRAYPSHEPISPDFYLAGVSR